ncbi:hypothetical protein CLHUN_12820 [Ruminiclostridium hungatei]|uniref:Uncharacterized protein n=1 Tax=Ruminiclostridium hungatei TaxID=48256 RepID=A0A1V4SMF9_RUMHU|nr:hypothetical protein [Ruminiclostridium hungatei]OPX45050.1 hypothetical protein CLHUN_12820 [Ruminiclostridium hungatei]
MFTNRGWGCYYWSTCVTFFQFPDLNYWRQNEKAIVVIIAFTVTLLIFKYYNQSALDDAGKVNEDTVSQSNHSPIADKSLTTEMDNRIMIKFNNQ